MGSIGQRDLSATCQQITFEDLSQPNKARVIVRTCLSDPQVLPTISEHLCNRVAITPSGLYADMAAVVAEYIWKASRGKNAYVPGLYVHDMHVDKTYIIKLPQPAEGQWVEMDAVTEVNEFSSGDMIDAKITCHFSSVKPDGTKIDPLAHCSVSFGLVSGWNSEWSHSNALLNTQIDNLHSRAGKDSSGQVLHMYREKAYRLFKTFVDYGPRYQNMSEVVVDTKTLEATANHVFQPDPAKDYTGPYYLDGSCHISGWVVNAIEENTDKFAYISHGFRGMRLTPRFKPGPGADIKTYVRMQPLPNDKTVLAGDVYVLQDGQIVGQWEDVQFKKIPRKVLNIFLPPPKK